MTIWTIVQETSLQFKHSPQVSGPPVFGGLEFTVSPALDQCHMEVENLDVKNAASEKWFAYLKAGFEEYESERQREGQPIGACRVTVHKIYWHETDSTARHMQYVGKAALRELFSRHQQQITIE